MIEALSPYAQTAYTDHDWLPAIPKHWIARRAKVAFREVDERSAEGSEELLSVSHKTGVTPRSEKNITMFMAESYEGHKTCQPGDIVVNTMWAWMAALGISRHVGIISPSYGVYRQRRENEFEPRFLDYLLRTGLYRAEYLRASRGITTSRLRLYPDDFLQIPLVQPPLDEQRLIVRFLDWHGAMTARLIRAKRRLIDVAAERRKALTQKVIIDGETQEIRFAHAADIMFRAVVRDSEARYTPIGLRNRGRGIFHKQETVGAELGSSTFSWIDDDDLILSGQFAWEGAVALAGRADKGCIASHRYHIVRGKPGVENSYLWCFLRSDFGHLLLNEHSRGAAGRNRPLNPRSLMKEKIPIPERDKQLHLAEVVEFEKEVIASVARFENSLQEFRTRLISDVVTGQLDIRAVAAGVPDLSDELAEVPISQNDLDDMSEEPSDEEVALA